MSGKRWVKAVYGGRSAKRARTGPSSRATGPSGAMVSQVYGRPGSGEVKGVDSDISQSLIATTSTNVGIDVLNLIAPGTASFNRVGRKTVLKSVKISGVLQWVNEPTFATGVGRIPVARAILVWDSQPSGTIPTFDSIFGTTLQAGTEQVTSIMDPIKYDGMERFRVIRDFRYTPGANPIPVSFGSAPKITWATHVNEYVKLPPLKSNYSGQTATQTIADIASGALYLIWRTESASAATTCTLDAMARLRYWD